MQFLSSDHRPRFLGHHHGIRWYPGYGLYPRLALKKFLIGAFGVQSHGAKVPVPDEKMQVMIDRLRLTKGDQAKFWTRFVAVFYMV